MTWTRHANAFITRFRVAIGFALGVVVLWLAEPTRATLLAGAVLAGVGEVLRVWAAGHLRKSREVTTSGPYRWFAHPLYVGSSVMGAGLVVACRSVVVALLVALYLGVALPAAARREEASLRQTFGDQYDRYKRGEMMNAVDGDGPVRHDGKRRFSVTRAIANHEHRALVGLLLAGLLLALKVVSNV
jgi:protein-S-isoprenylcysteine O-methyltransferase Ste14